MMAAEQWYEHSERYRRYGLAMKPEVKAKPKVKRKKPEPSSMMAPKEKLAVIFLVILVGVVCVGMIVTTAYCAKVKYEINEIARENKKLVGEIENLTVDIKSSANIQTIEEIAINELGMIRPSSKDLVYINDSETPEISDIQDFVLAMKVQAYRY